LKSESVSPVVVKRLPRYYRYLGELLKQNITRISSRNLAEKMGVTASQIRQDLNCFGGFGQQGYGYNVELLYNEIGEILGLGNGYKAIIVGAGHLGHALACHPGFAKRGFSTIGIFDIDKNVIGTEVADLVVKDYADVTDFVRENKPDIAILAVPKAVVGEVATRLTEAGIKALWNFAYTDLELPDSVVVENVHLSDSLMTLSYRLSNLGGDEK